MTSVPDMASLAESKVRASIISTTGEAALFGEPAARE